MNKVQKQDWFNVLVAVGIVLILWFAGIIRADAAGQKYEYTALIRCGTPLQEDSAAHLTLVRYGDGKITYRCGKQGF